MYRRGNATRRAMHGRDDAPRRAVDCRGVDPLIDRGGSRLSRPAREPAHTAVRPTLPAPRRAGAAAGPPAPSAAGEIGLLFRF
jgi:hypothetical protein